MHGEFNAHFQQNTNHLLVFSLHGTSWMGVNANVLIHDGGNYKSIIRKSLFFKHIRWTKLLFFGQTNTHYFTYI